MSRLVQWEPVPCPAIIWTGHVAPFGHNPPTLQTDRQKTVWQSMHGAIIICSIYCCFNVELVQQLHFVCNLDNMGYILFINFGLIIHHKLCINKWLITDNTIFFRSKQTEHMSTWFLCGKNLFSLIRGWKQPNDLKFYTGPYLNSTLDRVLIRLFVNQKAVM